jgi:hypothetical protein
MVRHVLLLKVRSDASLDDIEACRVGLASLVGVVPGLLNFHWGANVAPEERREGLTHGFTMDFVDRESLDAYAPHPAHRPVAAKVRTIFDRIVVLDIAMD